MRIVGGIVLLCLLALAHASAVLRVPLTKRRLSADQVRASQTALHQLNRNSWKNLLRGEPEEADIPLLDFLDAQCKSHRCWPTCSYLPLDIQNKVTCLFMPSFVVVKP